MTSQLIYYVNKQFPNGSTVSITSFKSSLTQHDIHFVDYGLTKSKIDDGLWSSPAQHFGQIWSHLAPKNQDGDNHNAKIPMFTVALHLV